MQSQKLYRVAMSVRRLLRRNAYEHVANLLSKLHPADVASILTELADRERVPVFRLLMRQDCSRAAETLKELGPDRGVELLLKLSLEEAGQVLQEMESDDAALLLSSLPEETVQKLLQEMGVQESAEIQGLLLYPEETAGRIMTPHVFALQEEVTVSEAIHTIQTAQELEMVFYLYVVDSRQHLVGVVSLRQLLLVPPSTPLKKIMTTDVISVRTDTDQEEVARLVALYDLLAIPVVDHENKLVGMVTVDDVIDVIKEEATEDLFHMAGVETDDHIYTPAWSSVRKRFPWLVINLGTALLAATIVAYYEPTIARFSFLAVFLPVVAGMGGNSGTQTLTVIVRGMVLGEVSWENSRAALFKEVLVGILNGCGLGILAGLVAFLWKSNLLLGVVLGTAMILNMFVAALAGTLVPLFLKKLGIDPALASSIFLTTCTDVSGFLSFLGLAALLLQYLPAA